MKTKVLAESNCVTARLGGKEAGVQSHRSMDKNRIGGLAGGVSGHKTTKPSGLSRKVNAAIVWRRFTFLSGEICLNGRPVKAGCASIGNGRCDQAEVSRHHSRRRMRSGSSRPRETSHEESWMVSPRRRIEPKRGLWIVASQRDVDAEPAESPKATSNAKDTKVDASGLNFRVAIFDFVDS